MSLKENESPGETHLDPETYTIETLDDEIKADTNCKLLLQNFHQYLLNNKDITPLEAGSMAGGADYYLRDYMIDNRRKNIFSISVDLIHGFAGNWYISNTLEPNMTELKSILIGIKNFYDYCAAKELITPTTTIQIAQACTQFDFYQQRIESFNDLTGDGYVDWNKACPLQ